MIGNALNGIAGGLGSYNNPFGQSCQVQQHCFGCCQCTLRMRQAMAQDVAAERQRNNWAALSAMANANADMWRQHRIKKGMKEARADVPEDVQ